MKADHARGAGVLLLCLLACAVLVGGALTAGPAVNVAVAATVSPNLIQQISPELLHEIQGLGIVLTADAPVVTDVEPNGGLTAGGSNVVITGTYFTGASKVTFGATVATFTVDSDTQITAHAPAHSAGTVQVQVTTVHGASPNTSADDYTYVAAPPTTATPTTATPTTATPTTAAPTTAAPTETTVMVTTTAAAAAADGGGISSGWIAFIVVIALVVLAALGAMFYMLGKKGGPTA
jgi:hypothetical protein